MNDQATLSIETTYTKNNKIRYILNKDGEPWDQDKATVQDYYKILTNFNDWFIFEYYELLQKNHS